MSPNSAKTVETGLNKFCARHTLPGVSNLKLLTGGANMELWAFDAGDAELVLRRYRNGQPPDDAEDRLSMATEAEVIKQVEQAGIKAPRIIGVIEQAEALGPGYVMSRMEGESLPTRLFRDDKYSAALNSLTGELATQLAKIHSVPVTASQLETREPIELLEAVEDVYEQAGYKSPVTAMALYWLHENLPDASADTCFLHGDFRMGNVLITEDGLSAVLDWELIHNGLPEQDLAWFCMPSWRFGRYEKIAGGVGTRNELITAYEAAGGRKIDQATLDWFLVYSSLSWGSMTVRMAHWWRQGQDRSLERLLVGTRVSEVEIDILLMLEDIAGIKHSIDLASPPAESPPQQGDVQPSELNEAAIEYLMNQVVAEATGAAKFHGRIAANALSISQRMIEWGPSFTERANRRLEALNLREDALISGLRNGTINWAQAELISHLRQTCLERLAMHQPKYAGGTVAKNKWRTQ